MLRILHTADWHLGVKLLEKDRDSEHRAALDFVVQMVKEHKIDVLVVAGDVFDTGAPSNSARKIYYNFLRQMMTTACRHIIIIGGNHDSPAMLEAPAEVLSLLNIHVVGAAAVDSNNQTDYDREVIILKNDEGEDIAAVGAVPFLRDRDLMTGLALQGYRDRVDALRTGLKKHYLEIASRLSAYPHLPKIVTGHLYAANTSLSDNAAKQESEHEIRIGDQEAVNMADFAAAFDYIALGHIHLPQMIGGHRHIRYSGSLLPLSFSERNDTKVVLLVEFGSPGSATVHPLPVPAGRKLIRIKGNKNEILTQLMGFVKQDTNREYWLEIVSTEANVPQEEFKALAEQQGLELLRVRIERIITTVTGTGMAGVESEKEPDMLTPSDIFAMRCEDSDLSPEDQKIVTEAFEELLRAGKMNE